MAKAVMAPPWERGVDYAKADFSIARAWLVHARGKVVLLALRASARCRAIA